MHHHKLNSRHHWSNNQYFTIFAQVNTKSAICIQQILLHHYVHFWQRHNQNGKQNSKKWNPPRKINNKTSRKHHCKHQNVFSFGTTTSKHYHSLQQCYTNIKNTNTSQTIIQNTIAHLILPGPKCQPKVTMELEATAV